MKNSKRLVATIVALALVVAGVVFAVLGYTGQGIYNDNGEKLSVGPGDVTCTPDGTGHGLVNTGDADLEFVATILFD